jgi:hypothetical protein
MFCALGGEGLAIFNACIANPTCINSQTTADLYEPLAALLAGIALSVAGVVAVWLGLRLAPRIRTLGGSSADQLALVRPHRP